MKKLLILILFVSFHSVADSPNGEIYTNFDDGYEFSYACFQPLYPWMSTDNYEVFYEHYFKKNYRDEEDFFYKNFTINPGIYFGKEIQFIEEIQTGWDDPQTLSIGTKLSSCATKERPVIIESEICGPSKGIAEVITEIDIKNREYFLPNFKGAISRIMVIKTHVRLGADCRPGSGDFPEYDIAVYGIVESNNEEYIIPLKISYENGVKKFIESRNVRDL
jgi:hypothetical protein